MGENAKQLQDGGRWNEKITYISHDGVICDYMVTM